MNLFNLIGNNNDPQSISSKLRKKRFEKFISLLNVSPKDRILDVGGYERIWEGSGLEENVTLLNLSFPDKKNPKFKYIEGDACNMNMIADKSFDIAFSNSVIEHVGNFNKQKKFSSEVQRVSYKHWIQTPNKYFPIEPHVLFPFFDHFPYNMKKYVASNWKYSHFKRSNLDVQDELSRLRLLTKKEMMQLFPHSMIFTENIIGLSKSITAYKQ